MSLCISFENTRALFCFNSTITETNDIVDLTKGFDF